MGLTTAPLGSVSMAPVTSLETLLGAVDGMGVAGRGSFKILPGCQGNTPLLWQVEGQEGGKLGGYSEHSDDLGSLSQE